MDEEIVKISPYNHARLRNEMYFGSRALHTQHALLYKDGTPVLEEISWVPAVYTALREIIDNSLDEFNKGYGNRIDVTYDQEECIISVEDNGRGIPIEWDSKHKMHKSTLALSHIMTGRNFEEMGESRGEVAGVNGVGAGVTNFCSEWFKVEIRRDGKVFTQNFFESANKLVVEKPVIKNTKSDKVGTKITLKLSKVVFPILTLPNEFIAARMYEIAICNPLIKVFYNGSRVKIQSTPEKSLFGTRNRPIIINLKWDKQKFRSRFFLKPNFKEPYVHSLVNNIPSFNGGSHIDAFNSAFYPGLLDAMSAMSKKRKLKPNRSDINGGLLVYNITQMDSPSFDSQSKSRLISKEAGDFISTCLKNPALYKDIISKHMGWIDDIYKRCAERTSQRDNIETRRLLKKKLKGKVSGLNDATGKDRSKCILFLGEGDSAITGMTNECDREIHGGLGLRGKILNVNGEPQRRILDNDTLVMVMKSTGLVIGEKADRSKLRYGKIYIAHDMDQDGFNIGALLINFFYTYWPELFDSDKDPFIYVFMTPFIIASKGNDRKYWHARNYDEFDTSKYNKQTGWDITRAKGLGAMEDEDWVYALANPELFPIVDDGKVKEALDLIFAGGRADDRKKWISL